MEEYKTAGTIVPYSDGIHIIYSSENDWQGEFLFDDIKKEDE